MASVWLRFAVTLSVCMTAAFAGAVVSAGGWKPVAAMEDRIGGLPLSLSYQGGHSSPLDAYDKAPFFPGIPDDQCALYKVGFTQDLYFQYIQYKVHMPDLIQFTLCMWTKFSNHSNDHPLFSYAVGNQPRAIFAWVSNTPRSSYFSMSVLGHTFFRLNYPLRLHRWYHSCFSWNGRTGEWQVWVNAERVGRGFHNRLVGHVIPGGGVAISGQEQRQTGGGFLEGYGAPKGSGGYLGELTMLQLYAAALSPGKAHRDHKHHHGNHYEDFPANGMSPNAATPPPPLYSNNQFQAPFLVGGQIQRPVSVINQLAGDVRPPVPVTDAPLFDLASLPLPADLQALTLQHKLFKRNEGNARAAPVNEHHDELENTKASIKRSASEESKDHVISKRSTREHEDEHHHSPAAHKPHVTSIKSSKRRTHHEEPPRKTSKHVKKSHKKHTDHVDEHKKYYSSKRTWKKHSSDKTHHAKSRRPRAAPEPTNSTLAEAETTATPTAKPAVKTLQDETVQEKLMKEVEAEGEEEEGRKQNKRGILFANSGAEDLLPGGIPVLRDTSLTRLIDDPNPLPLQQYGGYGRPKPPVSEHDDYPREPAEGEVTEILEICSGCAPEPFKKVEVISWRATPKKLYSGAIYKLANGVCRKF